MNAEHRRRLTDDGQPPEAHQGAQAQRADFGARGGIGVQD